ncbi:MAG: hypothetical protein WCK56_09865, partial [Alcaligenaceae bacterium]
MAAKKTVPREMIALLVKAKRVSIMPILNSLWLADSGTWEPYYVELGPAIEPTLLAELKDLNGGLRNSAVHMLGKVGGTASLTELEAAGAKADPELRVRIETAVMGCSHSGGCVTPPARAGCGLKHFRRRARCRSAESPRPRGRGAD